MAAVSLKVTSSEGVELKDKKMAVLALINVRLSHCILDQCSTSRFAMRIDSFLEKHGEDKSTRGLALQRRRKVALVFANPSRCYWPTTVTVLFQHHSGSEQ